MLSLALKTEPTCNDERWYIGCTYDVYDETPAFKQPSMWTDGSRNDYVGASRYDDVWNSDLLSCVTLFPTQHNCESIGKTVSDFKPLKKLFLFGILVVSNL